MTSTITAAPITIKTTLGLIFSSTPGNRSPYKNYYEATGPDGHKFTNSSKATLLDVLRRYYKTVDGDKVTLAKIVLDIEDVRAAQWAGDGNK